ncbi:hypothetical protein THARTR1_05762 [Trichoderma harzianum]|uniref:NADH-ubiquinone oxidoreductase 14.8 kDa subunit n=1 Tax=Trichoderma harzianum TaxID=5544 RepID=A0A2K0U793_TRIHA|nr:hypothetical protein THARTR1_05762 [Trichoderma harzianum]
MAITPTQFAKKTAQCEFFTLSRRSDKANMSNSDQLVGCEASSPFFVPRMDPSCTSHEIPSRDHFASQRLELKIVSPAPEIQTMYNVPLPISTLRTRMRQEFERHRYTNQLSIVDVLLFKSHAEYQETMNFWKQQTHILSYFGENFRGEKRLPSSFMAGFLEGRN